MKINVITTAGPTGGSAPKTGRLLRPTREPDKLVLSDPWSPYFRWNNQYVTWLFSKYWVCLAVKR